MKKPTTKPEPTPEDIKALKVFLNGVQLNKQGGVKGFEKLKKLNNDTKTI